MFLDDNPTRLRHILKAAREVQAQVADLTDEQLRTSIVMQGFLRYNLQMIGEAAARVTPAFRKEHPEVPWQQMIGMRHRLVHDYFEVNTNLVIVTVRDFLPPLIMQIEEILDRGD